MAVLLVMGGVALTGSGCASGGQTLPSINSSASPHIPGKFVWRDLLTTQPEEARRFYEELFGWEFADVEGADFGYAVARFHGRPIAGLVDARDFEDEVNVSQWVSSVSVDDVDRAVQRVRNLGGMVHREGQNLGPRGRMALVSDDRGALLALIYSLDGDPRDREAGTHEWMWTELWTDDVEAATAFYGGLLGYRRATLDAGVAGDRYESFTRNDTPRAGLIEYQVDGVRPNWLPYVRVSDAEATARRAEELGGRTLIPPHPELRDGSVALIADPSGAALVVQEWEPEQRGGR